MQYSTLRISTLVTVFSASTALAYLDCGGGRAPPKTTVPGCPGYVDPTAVAFSTSTSSIAAPTITASASSWVPDTNYSDSDYSSDSDSFSSEYSYTGDDDGLCMCSGYLCEFVEPGCVAVNTDTGARSTITANPGWETKTFDAEAYLSYIATAGPGMVLSSDGYMLSFNIPATELVSLATESSIPVNIHATRTVEATAHTSTGTPSPRATSIPSNLNATAASTLSTIASATTSSNTTAPTASQTVQPASTNGAPKTAFSSLAVLLVFGAGALAFF